MLQKQKEYKTEKTEKYKRKNMNQLCQHNVQYKCSHLLHNTNLHAWCNGVVSIIILQDVLVEFMEVGTYVLWSVGMLCTHYSAQTKLAVHTRHLCVYIVAVLLIFTVTLLTPYCTSIVYRGWSATANGATCSPCHSQEFGMSQCH